MTVYCQRSDIYKHGVPRGLLGEESRVITAVDTGDDTLTVENHGFALDDPVQLVTASGASLPTGLATETVYYVITVEDSDHLFQLSATAGGSAVNLSGTGTGTFGVTASIGATIDAAIEYVSRLIDQKLVAHDVQLTAPIPTLIVAICAKLAARELLARLGRLTDQIDANANRAWADLEVFARGAPVRDDSLTPVAISAQRWGDTDRGWALDSGRVL